MNDRLPEDNRQNGGAPAWLFIGIAFWLCVAGCVCGRFTENGAWIIGSGKIVNGEQSVECLQLPNLGRD